MARKGDPPCDHFDRLAGTIEAGELRSQVGAFCGVATCYDCITKSAGYVQMETGLPAKPFRPYPPRGGEQLALDQDAM